MGNRSPLLNVIFQSLNNVTRNMLRDFGEIENLQVSPNSLEEFVSKTEKKISTSLLHYLKKSRPEWGIKLNNDLDFVIGSDLIQDIFYWKNFDKIILEVSFFIILREGYPVESNTLKMLETNRVKFKISTIKTPNISSSKFRLNFNCSNLPSSLIDLVKKNNLYVSTKLVE